MNDAVPGYYYASQLTKAPAPQDEEYFFVEKILRQKTVKNKKYYFVKYLFYPNKFNQWVEEANIKQGKD